ncbi:alpha-6-galactosyltransferase [Hordeum vulgare]|nr:alpha-6-galactosyltransferase [Hordeum vulgare]
MNTYLTEVLQHPQSIEIREGMLHIHDVEGPKKTGSVETRLEAMEQQVFKCQGMVERGLNVNHMMITKFTNKHKMDANDIGKHLSRLYDMVDQLQGQIYDLQSQNCEDKLFNESDDQSVLVYMLQHKCSPWRGKVFLENIYYFQGYWVEIVGRIGGFAARYEAMEWRAPAAALLRRRHAVSWEHEGYAHAREATLAGVGLTESGVNGWRRPFVTHFTGCQPCSGDRNRDYSGDSCERLGEHVELPGCPANS